MSGSWHVATANLILFIQRYDGDPEFRQVLSSSWDERPFGHNRHGLKRGGLLCPYRGRAGSHLTQCGLGRGLPLDQVVSWSIQPFGNNKHGPKIWGGSAPLLGRGLRSPHLTQSRLGRGLPPHQAASWSMQPFGCNRYGPKLGRSAPLGERSWVPI